MISNKFHVIQNIKSLFQIRYYGRKPFVRKSIEIPVSNKDLDISEAFGDENPDSRTYIFDNDTKPDKIEMEEIRKRIIFKKTMDKKPPEFAILTQRAKEQMFHLHTEKSMSAEELSENFPISLNYCIKLMESNLVHKSLQDLIKDNESIINRLYLLRSLCKKDRLHLYHEYQWIITEDKYPLIKFANGNDNFSYPTMSTLEMEKAQEEKRIPGEMETLYKITTMESRQSQFLLSDKSENHLEKQTKIISSILAFFIPEFEKVKNREREILSKERPQLDLPDVVKVNYSDMFKYKFPNKYVK